MKTIKKVHISNIRQGDTIKCKDGFIRTVNKEFIKNGFMGVTLFGDSYKLGTEPVLKVIFNNQ